MSEGLVTWRKHAGKWILAIGAEGGLRYPG